MKTSYGVIAMKGIAMFLVLLMAFPAASFADAKKPRANKANRD